MLFNINTLSWDNYLLDLFDIPESINNVEFLNDTQFLQNLKINQKVNTLILINSLIDLVVLDKENKITKFWIDLLIQRFEVTRIHCVNI